MGGRLKREGIYIYIHTHAYTYIHAYIFMASLAGGKNPPAVQETQEMQAQLLGQEDSLEEGMAMHFSILAWIIPWTEELCRLCS